MNEKQRLWLMFPTKLVTRPVLWELGQKFPVITNIRQTSVTDEIGIVSLSLEGEREEKDTRNKNVMFIGRNSP